MWSISETQSGTNQSSYRHQLLPLVVCAALELISTHSLHSGMGSGFLAYFMLVWMLRIVHTDHDIVSMEKEGKMMMQIGFCWIRPSLICLSCRLSHFHTLHPNETVFTEDTTMPSSPEVSLSGLSSSSLFISHL